MLPLFLQQDGKTPLYAPSMFGHTEVVKILLQHNADPNIISDEVSCLKNIYPEFLIVLVVISVQSSN